MNILIHRIPKRLLITHGGQRYLLELIVPPFKGGGGLLMASGAILSIRLLGRLMILRRWLPGRHHVDLLRLLLPLLEIRLFKARL